MSGLTRIKVVRYAADGGYAPREWARAIAEAGIDAGTKDGGVSRVGVQITKKRVIDVLIRVERLDGFGAKVAAAFKRSRSDSLFRSRRRLRGEVPGAKRALAVLSGELGGDAVRVLLAEPAD